MEQPSYSLCLLRLSALGDVTHVLPLVRTLQRKLPEARLHWIIDTYGSKLLNGLDGVHWHVYDKRTGLAGMRALRAELVPVGYFDALLHMQVALRANLLSAFVAARHRIGYDRNRSKDLHGLFINQRIPEHPGIHVLDTIGNFCKPLGIVQHEVRWDLPVSEEARSWALAQWSDDGRPVLIISPCSSQIHRNWKAERYAAMADHAAAQGWRIVLCGGRSTVERQTADMIIAQTRAPLLDMVGKDTLKQLPALLERADLVMTPDSGPMHIANALGKKVLGLHAASNPRRSGPYSDVRYCVDRYDAAARRYLGKPSNTLKWGTKIECDGVMDLVTVKDTIAAFERYRTDYKHTST
ncbi:MAG TPA: glycosyltransferase family 9 protein [Xylella sp.]